MKTILNQRKLIRNNDKIIIGVFIGGIIMTVIFTLLSWSSDTKFKDIASVILSSITILIGLFTAAKVLKWHEIKRNNKGFEVIESITMNTYELYSIVSEYNRLIDRVDTKGLNEEYMIKKMTDDNYIIQKKYNEINSKLLSLSKWKIKIKIKIEKDIVDKIAELSETQFIIIDDYFHTGDYISLMRTQKKEMKTINNKMEEYNKLTIDDIYEFDN